VAPSPRERPHCCSVARSLYEDDTVELRINHRAISLGGPAQANR
jgi:hypothetical protein